MIAKDFKTELPKNGNCSFSSFFSSGAIAENECGIKVTDFLRSHKSDLEEINANIGTALSYYAGIESLGNPTFDQKLEKNIQSLL